MGRSLRTRQVLTAGLFLWWAGSTEAQTSGHRPRPVPPGGKVVMEVTPRGVPTSLRQLVDMSDVIVDGFVASVLPSFNPNQNADKPGAETHSIVAVSSVLSGAIPNRSTNIVVAQMGGKAGKWDVAIEGDTLPVQGERYILFLTNDDARKEVPNTTALPRYVVVGVWSGKVRVVNDRISFPAHASSTLQQNNSTDVSRFIQTVKDINKGFGDKGLPIHPTPHGK
jgi:hypothetical protein